MPPSALRTKAPQLRASATFERLCRQLSELRLRSGVQQQRWQQQSARQDYSRERERETTMGPDDFSSTGRITHDQHGKAASPMTPSPSWAPPSVAARRTSSTCSTAWRPPVSSLAPSPPADEQRKDARLHDNDGSGVQQQQQRAAAAEQSSSITAERTRDRSEGQGRERQGIRSEQGCTNAR